MKTKLFAALINAAALLSISTTFAATSLSSGWYLDGTVGSSKQEDYTNSGLSTNTTGLAGSMAMGYKFMPFIAAEVGVSQYALNRLQNSSETVIKVRTRSYYLAAKGIVPIANSGFEPFAKVGISRLTADPQVVDQTAANAVNARTSNASATGFYMGAGAQYYFLPELAVIAEWARANGSSSSTGNMDLYSIGLSYIFG